MAATITPDLLRVLAGFKAERGRAVSLYVNLDPSVAPTQPAVAARISALLSEAERRAVDLKDELSHDEREALKSDLERIERWFAAEFDRDGARGTAVFAATGEGFWEALTIAEPVVDEVRIDEDLHLAPLVGALARPDALVAYVGRERADLYRWQNGELVAIADRTEDVPGQHDQGGWSQARYGRHIENVVGQHLRRVADTLDTCVRPLRDPVVVLVGAEEMRSEFEGVLSNEVKERLAGWTAAERHASPSDLLAVAEPVLAAWRERRDAELIGRWREEAGRDGRASAGWEQTLAAASEGRVELLLVGEGVSRSAYRCPQCGRAEASAGNCPLDGTELAAHPDAVDLAVHQTLAHGGSVSVVRAHRDLEPVEGIGALLRF